MRKAARRPVTLGRIAALAITGAIAMVTTARATDDDVRASVAGLQRWLGASRTLEASFRQTLESGAFGAGIEETGRLYIERPGRIRWDYLEPELKTALILGERTLLYLAEDRQLIRGRVASEHAFLPELLAGRRALTELFVVSAAEGETRRGRSRVRLVPRSGAGGVEEAILGIDSVTFAIEEAEILDAAGNRTRFRFDGWKRNRRLPEGVFAFEPPAGTEIVDAD